MNINETPQIIKDFIAAANKPDPGAFLDCFSEEAAVMDEGQKRYGKAAIKEWSDKHHFAYNVQLEPLRAEGAKEEITVTCKVDGDFDKTGLPAPLLLDFHFKLQENEIVELMID